MTEEILLYVGTILVADEIVSSFANLPTFLLTAPMAFIILKYLPRRSSIRAKLQIMFPTANGNGLFYRLVSLTRAFIRIILFYVIFTSIITILILAVIMAFIVIILIFIISLLRLPSAILNKLYLNLIRQMSVEKETRYVFLPLFDRLFRLGLQGNTNNTGDSISRRLENMIRISASLRHLKHIPFNGYLGIVLITASFIIELVNK